MAESSDLQMLENGDTGRGQNGSSRHRSRSPIRKSRSRSRSPREWRRGERNRSRDRDRERRFFLKEDHRGKVRLYVCNMPYDVNWQFLKDFFKKELGSSVTYVEMYDNPDGKASGAAVVEIKGKENAEMAIDKFDRSEMKGRRIIVREEREKDRMRHQGMGGGGGGLGGRDMGDMRGGGGMNMGMGGGMNMGGGGGGGGMMGGGGMGMGGGGGGMANSSNISPQIIQQLNIDPNNITNQVFVANLDYKVSARKLRDIFKMAGTVVDVELKEDKDGKSRGMCVIKFEHPVEAVQAISMFNGQMLYERTMSVKMDKLGDSSYAPQQIPNKLPSGLQGIGMGLGSGGAPVNVQQIQGGLGGMLGGGSQGMMGNMGGMNSGMGNMGGGGMGMSSPLGMGGAGMGSGMGGMGSGMSSSMNPMGGMGTSGMGMGGQMTGMGGGAMGDMGMPGAGMGGGAMGGGLADMSMGGMNMGSSMGSGMGSSMGGSMDRGYSGSGSMGGGMSSRGGGGNNMPMESTTVFVRNIPFSFSWQDLKQKFNSCGEVRYAEVKMENGKSKGYGTVKFMTPEDARRAVNLMNGARIEGRQIEVRLNRV